MTTRYPHTVLPHKEPVISTRVVSIRPISAEQAASLSQRTSRFQRYPTHPTSTRKKARYAVQASGTWK